MKKNYNIKKLPFLLFVIFCSCINDEFEKEILIETGSASNIQIVTATLTGTIIDFGEGINQYGHCWSTNQNPTVNDEFSVVSENSNGKYTSNINGLLDETVYYYRSYAKNGNNVVYGEVNSFMTLEYGIPIVGLNIQEISYREISGNINLINLGGYELIEEIGICWSKESNPTFEDSSFSYFNINATGNYSFTMNNLDDGELYYIRAYAKYDNEILYTSEVSYSTLEYSLPEILINTVTKISNTSLTVNIETVDFGGYDLLENYGLCWGEMPNPTIDNDVVEFGPTSIVENKEVLLDNLDSLKTYYVKAFAINEKGISYSDETSIRMGIIVSEGLVAYYPFDGDVNDYSGNENNATNYGATLTSDRFGKINSAYKFDGLNDYMRIDHTEELNFDTDKNSYTLSFWVKGNSSDISLCRIIEKWNELIQTPYPFSIAASSTECYIRIKDAENSSIGPNCGNIWDETWQHIILVVNKNNGFMISYINSIMIGSTDYSSLGSTENNTDIYLGGHPALSDRYFNGYIDDVRFYNKALTEDEIQELYHENDWDL